MCEGCVKSSAEIIYKTFSFDMSETKSETRDGIKYGIVSGYASTYGNLDRGGDIVAAGAFTNSIKRHRENNRPIRMLYQHQRDKLIGGFPIDKVRDDEKGLFVVGEINLEVPEGKAAYALAKQGVLTDFSIGFSINDAEVTNDGVKVLKELELWEVSPVAEPMNPEAVITSVKGATNFKNFPLADRDRPWSAAEAAPRVREKTGSVDAPSERYRDAFFWFDSENPDIFGSYKLPFVDVVEGQLMAIPRAIFNAAARLNQTQIPPSDKTKVANHINRYYDKMGLDSPLKSNGEIEQKLSWIQDLVKGGDDDVVYAKIESFKCMKDIENFLKEPVPLSSSCRKILISKIKSFSRDAEDDNSVRDAREKMAGMLDNHQVLTMLNEINKTLKEV